MMDYKNKSCNDVVGRQCFSTPTPQAEIPALIGGGQARI